MGGNWNAMVAVRPPGAAARAAVQWTSRPKPALPITDYSAVPVNLRARSACPHDARPRAFQMTALRVASNARQAPNNGAGSRSRVTIAAVAASRNKTMEVEEAPSFDQHLLSSAFFTDRQRRRPAGRRGQVRFLKVMPRTS